METKNGTEAGRERLHKGKSRTDILHGPRLSTHTHTRTHTHTTRDTQAQKVHAHYLFSCQSHTHSK